MVNWRDTQNIHYHPIIATEHKAEKSCVSYLLMKVNERRRAVA